MTEKTTSQSASPMWHRNAFLAGGGVALAGLGLAAGMMLRNPAPSAADTSAQQAAIAASASEASGAGAKADAGSDRETPTPAAHKRAPSHAATKVHRDTSRPDTYSEARTETRPVAVCENCGVIESVRAVQQRGQGTGLGAVAGGVLGGAVGNQMGKGQGNAAMTVLGAVGGGLLGNEVEKSQRTNTVYEVRVRMDGGGVRTFTQATEPATGTRVQLDGDGFHAIRSSGSAGE